MSQIARAPILSAARIGLSAALLVVLAALIGVAPDVVADEEKNAKEIWVYTKDSEKREVTVTHMAPELREAVNAQLEAKGWKRVAVDLELEDQPLPVEPPKKDAGKLSESTKRDIEELVKGGGKLPEGFKPHALGSDRSSGTADEATTGMARAAGRVMLRYLEVKDDPVRGPVYEKVLGQVAKMLAEMKPGADTRQVGMRMLGTFMQGMNDPETAPVYREIVQLVSKEMVLAESPDPGRRPPPVPRKPLKPGDPIFPTYFVGGAHVRMTATISDGAELGTGYRVLGVEPGSEAHEMGLRGGDTIRKVNGKEAGDGGLETIRNALGKPGKLTIEVKRKNFKIEVLDIEFEAAEPAGRPGK